MAEVHIVDIDGEQWDMKDLPLTNKVENIIAEKGTIFSASRETIYSQSWIEKIAHFGRVPKGKYLICFDIEPGSNSTGVMAVSGYIQTYVMAGYGISKNVTNVVIEVTNEVADFTQSFNYAVQNPNGGLFTPKLLKI